MHDLREAMEAYFQQIHIDAARNSTDDFNPFHDPGKWAKISANPFGSPIVLGFQLECLIEYVLTRYREASGETEFIAKQGLYFRNYQLTFADILRPLERFSIDIKPTLAKLTEDTTLSNRILIRKDTGLVLSGHVRDTATPLYLSETDFSTLGDLKQIRDRSFLPDSPFFLKRKFLNTGNAKNFISGSLAEQAYYFDELEDRVNFPDMAPVALLSCALLEKAMKEGHDFIANPMVYTAHHISVDQRLARASRSNDVLHILVQGPEFIATPKGLSQAEVSRQAYRCFGLVKDNQLLYRAEVIMAPLKAILGAKKCRIDRDRVA